MYIRTYAHCVAFQIDEFNNYRNGKSFVGLLHYYSTGCAEDISGMWY